MAQAWTIVFHIIVDSGIPICAHFFFSELNLTATFILIFTAGCMLYALFNSIGDKLPLKTWYWVMYPSYLLSIILFIFLCLISINYIGSTDGGLYFKGTIYTEHAKNKMKEDRELNDDTLVIKNSYKTSLIWEDYESKKNQFKIFLFIGIIFAQFASFANLQIYKYLKSETVPTG